MIDSNSPSVLVRAWLLGVFQVQRRTENGTWETLDKTKWEKSYARPLFKRLLCTSGRRAQRITLIDDLWPDPEHPELVERYLNDASYHLRKVLGAPELLQTFGHASGYQLADQSRIWTDVDECTALMTEGEKIGRTSAPAVRLLEQAQAHFERGDMLEGEAGLWCHARRGVVERLRYRCQLWLAEAYEQQGLVGQAEMQYSRLFEDNPLDEDVLCRLMSLLHRQGMTQQARRCFEETNKRFKQDGLRLSPATDAFAQRLLNEPRQIEFTVSTRDTESYNEAVKKLEAVQKTTQAEEVGILEEKDMNRRGLLHAMFGTALLTPLLGEIQLPRTVNAMAIETSYPRWVIIMETFWRLYFTGGIPVIEMCLPNLLSELTATASQSSTLQKQVMALASQAYQMQWLLALQRQDFGQALLAIDQAYTYGKEAQDANLELASLVRKAHVYFHVKNPVKQLSIHEQAAHYVDSVSPLMGGWFYLLLAENHASLRHDKDATTFLDLAHKMLSNDPTQDGTFSYVQMNAYLISNFEIICQLHLDQPRKALDTLEHLGLSVTDPRCSELSNHRLTALYLLNEMDELCRQFAPTVQIARQTNSNLRYHELCSLYCKMIMRWPKEQKVRELEALLYS